MWLLRHYKKCRGKHGCDVLNGKERKLFAEFVPRVEDTTVTIRAHTIDEFYIYIFEDGMCGEIKNLGSYKVPSTDSLYERYVDDDDEWI